MIYNVKTKYIVSIYMVGFATFSTHFIASQHSNFISNHYINENSEFSELMTKTIQNIILDFNCLFIFLNILRFLES